MWKYFAMSLISACMATSAIGAAKVSDAVTTKSFRFNVPNFLHEIDLVKTKSVNNGQQVIEQYFVGSQLVGSSSHSVFQKYNARSLSPYKDKEDFVDSLKNSAFFKSRLSNSIATEFSFAGDFGVIAKKGDCFWIRIAKDIGGIQGPWPGKNILVNLVSCKSISFTPIEFLKKFGRATEVDKIRFVSRVSAKNRAVQSNQSSTKSAGAKKQNTEAPAKSKKKSTSNISSASKKRSFAECFKNPKLCDQEKLLANRAARKEKLPLASVQVQSDADRLSSRTKLPKEVLARLQEKHRDAIAVIIGNKNYTGRLPAVDYAQNDAHAIKQFVIERLGYRSGNIIDLRDATRNQIEIVFGSKDTIEGKLFDWIKPGKSDVFVFYSGHGAPGINDKRPYLLPIDGDANRAELSGFSVDLLYKNLASIPAKSVTVFLDACFSGESPKGMLVQGTSGVVVVPKLPANNNRLTILTAAQGDQFASWDEKAKHGLFTKYLIDALYGAADKKGFGNSDGKITLREVQNFLDDEMSYQARRKWGRRQKASVRGTEKAVLATIK